MLQQQLKEPALSQKVNQQKEPLSLPYSYNASDQRLQQQVDPATYQELFYFADRLDWIIIAIAVIFSLGSGVSIVFYSIPIKQLVNTFSNTIDKDKIVEDTLKSVLGFFINSIIAFVNCWLMTAAWTITSERQMNRARKQYFESLLKQQVLWHDHNRPAEVCSKMYIQIGKVQQGIVTNMTSVLNKISLGVSGIIMALVVGCQMASIMICFMPIMIASGYIRGQFMKKKDMYLQTKKIKLDSDVIQVFDNIKTIKMLSSEEYEILRYKKQLKKQQEQLWAHGWKGALSFTFFFFCIIANYALGFWYGSKLVADETINSNTGQKYNTAEVVVIFFTLYISNLNLSGLPDNIASLSVSRYSMNKILSIIRREPNLKEGHKLLPQNIQRIKFNNVSFKYDKPLFNSLNLLFERGLTGLIGQSGCGKSTIISLLMRFYDVEKGSVQFQSKGKQCNIAQICNQSLRFNIGYVGQQPVLIGKTIREALITEQLSQQEIFNVLEVVKAVNFVKQIGLDSDFRSLSGGQKQRLAIARALLKKPQILILDESTSALDHKTEVELMNSLKKSNVNFIIMIAHREQTLKFCQRIIKVQKDEVLFEGTYKQLVERAIITEQSHEKEEKRANFEKKDHKAEELQEIKKKVFESDDGERKQSNIGDIGDKFVGLKFQMSYFWRLIKLNGQYKFLYFLAFLGAVYFGCIFPSFSYLISKIIFVLINIANSTPDTLPEFQAQAHSLSIVLFLISLGSLIFTTMRWVIFQYFNENIGYIVKSSAFQKLISRNFSQIQDDQQQTYSYMINKSCQDLKPLSGNFMPLMIQNLITLIVGMGIAFYFSWQITLISLTILPLILLSSKMMMSFSSGMQSNTEQLHKKNHQIVINSIMYIRTVKSCYLEKRIINKYKQELDQALKVSIKYGNMSGILFGIGQSLISMTFALISFLGAVFIQNDWINVQDFFTSMLAFMFAGVQAGGNLYFLGQLGAAKTGASVYFEIIDRNSELQQVFIEDESNPPDASEPGGSVQFNEVCFGYKSRGTQIFDNFCLSIKPNQKIGIVGESGSGKSSLGSLLFKLYQPEKGCIKVNGQEISLLSKKKLERLLGVVMQEPALFNRSVYENIKYNNKQVTDEEIVQICKAINAYDFILDGNFGIEDQNSNNQQVISRNLPEGFFKRVGPRGAYLSGGQKQRISIARALIRKPKILLLDEATSALDKENQKVVQDTIEQLTNTTQIIIAHRLSTIKNCDRIVILKNGKIVEQGKYGELIEKKGYFYDLSSNNSLEA